MNGVKNASSPGERDERPCGAVGDVYDDFRRAKIHLSEAEAGAGFGRDSRVVGVEDLVSGHVIEIDVDLANGVHDCSKIIEFVGGYWAAGPSWLRCLAIWSRESVCHEV